MGYNLIILPLAQQEIGYAINWYELKQKGLGGEFITYLDNYLLTLRAGGAIFKIRKYPYFRELPLKKFPFVIIYEIRDNDILIFSVFNTHQNPTKKLK